MPKEELDIEQLISLSQGFSGAEIVSVCHDAAMLSIEQNINYIKQENLLQVIQTVEKQITIEMLQFYENFASECKI